MAGIDWDSAHEHPESVYQQLLDAEGDTLVLTGDRAPDRVWSPEMHLSAEVFDALASQMRLWLGTRMIRHHNRTGKGAQHVTIEIKVSTAGPLEIGGEPPRVVKLDVVDGKVQLRAIEGGGA